MSRLRIIIKGYYGFGNLGDDVLAIVAFRSVRANFPDAEIFISTDSPYPHYVSALLGENIPQIKSDHRIGADWLIQGGGGVYFDFMEGGGKFALLNKFIRLIGYSGYRKLVGLYRLIMKRYVNKAEFTLGIGIGVGTYTRSSSRFYYDVIQLSSYDLLMVRDDESQKNVASHGFRYPVETFTDLAFLHTYWNKVGGNNDKAKKMGIVLRDWKFDNHAHQIELSATAAELLSRGWQVVFYSFDRNADKIFISSFADKHEIKIWDPAQGHLDEFLADFATCQMVLTSRAHGAILAACLGIPSICLCIEPKLEKISAMLKRSSLLLRPPFVPAAVIAAIEDHVRNLDKLGRAVAEDVRENQELMERGMKRAIQFMRSKSKAV